MYGMLSPRGRRLVWVAAALYVLDVTLAAATLLYLAL